MSENIENNKQNVSASRWVKNLFYILAGLSFFIISYSYYLGQTHEYQLVQLSDFRRDQYLIDKKTGRTWVNICMGEVKGADCDGEILWQEKLAVGLNGYTSEDFKEYVTYLSDLKKKSK